MLRLVPAVTLIYSLFWVWGGLVTKTNQPTNPPPKQLSSFKEETEIEINLKKIYLDFSVIASTK